MNSSRLAEMFDRVLSLPVGERAAWLYRNCHDDPTLRACLESLLRAHEQAGGFLESVPPDLREDPAPRRP
jgi:hypothetical protein